MLRTAQLLLMFFLVSSFSVNAQTGGAAKPCEPRVETSSLLSAVDVNVTLAMSKLYARCLPMPAKKSKTNYEYHPYDGGKFSTTLKSASGQTINTYVWYGENILSLWEMSRYEVVGGPEAVKKLSAGNYVLEFAVEDKVFQQFPFSFTTKQSSDQFRPETLYLVDGMWRDYAQLYAPNVDRFFQLMVWLRDEDSVAEPKRRRVPFRLRLIRESDKKTVAESDEGSALMLDHKWHDVKLSFRRPGAAQTKDYSELKLSEVIATDGKYRIELALEGRPVANYPFTVKSGRINDIDLAQMRKEIFRIMIPLNRSK
jgi:hypothetical protein